MRIILIGQAPFGAKVLERLIENSEEIVGVFAPPERNGKVDPLSETAVAKGVELFNVTSMKTDEVYQNVERLAPDLSVMAFVTMIVPENILYCPKYDTIQYHPSLLPKHRGASAINWAIINGDNQTGLTIFWPNHGLDTGQILLQKKVAIEPDDTVGSLYFNKLFPLGVEALIEAIELIKVGKASRIPQDETQATYERICKADDAVIDWRMPVTAVYNLIRGTDPQPGASTLHNSQTIKVFDVQMTMDRYGVPGEVVEVEMDGFWVAAEGGAIKVRRARLDASNKLSASEYVERTGLRVGDRLGNY